MVAATLVRRHRPGQVQAQRLRHGTQVDVEPAWDGLPPQEFLSAVDPLFDGVREKLNGDI